MTFVITFEPLTKRSSKKLRPNPAQSEYLEENRPDYVTKAELRRQILAEKAYVREQQDRVQHKQRILLTNLKHPGSESDEIEKAKRGGKTQGSKIFTTRELRSMTRRKYQTLPEVQMKKMDAKRKEDYRTNKLMAEVFTKKLQRKALKGVVDLSNSDQVLSQVS
ncbi:hypothetical protein M8J75_006610 [Diaphorina citri]|nr:hypothetical protein M8J75_006610 [Diaphorina citri]